jgi:hypothetical protein
MSCEGSHVPRRSRQTISGSISRLQCAPLELRFSFHRRTMAMQETDNPFSEAFGKAVDLGNRIADTDQKADIWDIADGLLAGAVQYWLYSRQPCSDPECEECLAISTAESRLEELRKLMRQFAEESEYFHSPTDRNVGRA